MCDMSIISQNVDTFFGHVDPVDTKEGFDVYVQVGL